MTEPERDLGGKYRGVVVDDTDPMQRDRLRVRVPELGDDDLGWAERSVPTGEAPPTPEVGAEVWVSFEHGDVEHPVWEHPTGEGGHQAGGYTGKYLGEVQDNLDPLGELRVSVVVPEVAQEPAWATAGPAAGTEPPGIGAHVWIEYEHGDVQHPVWVGLA